MNDLIKNKIKEVNNFFNVELNPDDPKLSEQITLGKNWDNPFELTKALDMQPAWYARWAYLLKELQNERAKLQSIYDVWASGRRKLIRKKIVKRKLDKGVTITQANNITQSVIDDEFNLLYSYNGEKKKIFLKYKNPIDEIELQIEKVKIVVDAFKQRKDLLSTMGYLVRSMIENNIMIKKKKKK